MKQTELAFVLTIIILSGCDNDATNSPLLGIWQTEVCEQTTDRNNQPLDSWVKGIYEFTAQGTIRLGHYLYTDSN